MTKYHPQRTSITRCFTNYDNIDFHTFVSFSQMNCHYCGTEPYKTVNAHARWKHRESYKVGNFTYNGIDKIDPKLGYNIRNIVPCCFICNSSKGTRNYIDFIKWSEQVYVYQMLNSKNSFIDINYINEILNNSLLRRAATNVWASYYRDDNINFNNFLNLSQSSCNYCGNKQTNIKNLKSRHKKPEDQQCIKFIYNGLDRIDNNIGHTLNNVVTCCKYCNRTKLNNTLEYFISYITKLHNNIFLKKINVIDVSIFISKYIDISNNYYLTFPLQRINL